MSTKYKFDNPEALYINPSLGHSQATIGDRQKQMKKFNLAQSHTCGKGLKQERGL